MIRKIISGIVIFICLMSVSISADDESSTTQIFTKNHWQLTKDRCMKGYSDWSPDGKHIIFTSMKNQFEGNQDGNLWVIPSGGGYPLRLTSDTGHHGVYSPGGKQIVYDGEYGSEVRLMPSSGGEWKRIVPGTINVENSANPCWSPDGSKIAFRAFDELMILDIETGDIKSVYKKDDYKPMPIQWSKSDNCILVANVCPAKKDGNLWKIPLDGGTPKQMTFHKTYVSQATVSPCGKYILFSSIADEKAYNLYIMPYEGGKELKITDDTWHYIEPSWCPVDNRVVFTSLRSGYIDLWMMELNMEAIEESLKSPIVF